MKTKKLDLPKYKKDEVIYNTVNNENYTVKEEPEWNGYAWMYSFKETAMRCGQEYCRALSNHDLLLHNRKMNALKFAGPFISIQNSTKGLDLLLSAKNNKLPFISDIAGNLVIQGGNKKESLEFWTLLSELCEGAINELK